MWSMDFNAAFDLVSVELVTKRLYTIGLPRDVVRLIKLWLSSQSLFVSVDVETLILRIFHVE
jgi:hypothetical protein